MIQSEIVILCVLVILWVISVIYAIKLGFNMGRQTVDKPVSEPKDQGTGQPVLADYDPYADAMGDDSFRETVGRK